MAKFKTVIGLFMAILQVIAIGIVGTICDGPTDMIISVQPDGDSGKVAVMQEGPLDNDADRREMVEQIAAQR